MSDEPDLESMRLRLQERRQELDSIAQSSTDAARTVDLDQSRVGRLSRMDALQAQAMAKESERRRQLELQRIGAALERIDSGEYGYCRACDEPIPATRLAVNPAVVLCLGCASAAEAQA